MKNLRNDFTDHVLIIVAVMIPALIGAGIGGGTGYLISLVIGAPITLGLIRYIEGSFPSLRNTGK
ncbi:MAG: hypothetical protein O2788_03135 [Chloroflexi bacterium]|nr:hypothetical protein [Chloroflexota bacterium]